MSWDFARIGVHRPSLRFPYLVFSIRSYLPLDFNRVSSLRPSYRHPFGRSFTYSLFRRVSGLGTGSGTRCCCPRGGQRCAWSRKLDPNFWSGRGRTSDLGIRLPRTPPFSCLLRHAGGCSRTILTPNLQGLNLLPTLNHRIRKLASRCLRVTTSGNSSVYLRISLSK